MLIGLDHATASIGVDKVAWWCRSIRAIWPHDAVVSWTNTNATKCSKRPHTEAGGLNPLTYLIIVSFNGRAVSFLNFTAKLCGHRDVEVCV